jgi:NTE family protein
MPRTGLVLGAGGIVGQACHSGVLASLEHDLGWDPRSANVIVGTSAGSVTGTLLRLGVTAHDLAAWAVEAPLSVESDPCSPVFNRGRPELPPLSLRCWARRWRRPSPELLRRIARKPWTLRPGVLAMTMMPAGEVDLVEHAGVLDTVAHRARACGRARRASVGGCRRLLCHPWLLRAAGHRGRGVLRRGCPLSNERGRPQELDLVIVVAPMSAAGGMRKTADALVRYGAHRRLEREVRALRDHGTTVVRIEPGEQALGRMGINMMAEDRADAVVQAAFIETGAYAASPRRRAYRSFALPGGSSGLPPPWPLDSGSGAAALPPPWPLDSGSGAAALLWPGASSRRDPSAGGSPLSLAPPAAAGCRERGDGALSSAATGCCGVSCGPWPGAG